MDSVYELRRYTLEPGRRDELIELFDREFVETQDAVGAHVVAQYRDLDDPDQFVWIRGFADKPFVTALLFELDGAPTDAVLDRVAGSVGAALVEVEQPPAALWATLSAVNDYPALPVRDVRGVVAVLQHGDAERQAAALETLGRVGWGASEPELLRLAPTSRAHAFLGHEA